MINGNANIGMVTGGLSETLAPEIMKLADDDPAKAQWLSYVLGYATDRIMGGNGQQGGSISQYATKWNSVLVEEINDNFKDFFRQKIEENNYFIEHYSPEHELVDNLPNRDKNYYRGLAVMANQIKGGMGAYLDMATRTDYENQLKYGKSGITLVAPRIYKISADSTIGKVITDSNSYNEIIHQAYIKIKFSGKFNIPIMFRVSG